jgi:Na+-driven multidrug efflux pump
MCIHIYHNVVFLCCVLSAALCWLILSLLITQAAITAVVVAARGWIAALLTSRPDVQAETAHVMPAVAACFVGGVRLV